LQHEPAGSAHRTVGAMQQHNDEDAPGSRFQPPLYVMMVIVNGIDPVEKMGHHFEAEDPGGPSGALCFVAV
jgi:hypothetical protein